MLQTMTTQTPQAREAATPKIQYRVTNWPEYDRVLVERGSLTIWSDEEFLQDPVWPAARSDGAARVGRRTGRARTAWPTSVGKSRLIEAIKTLALTDAAFAELVTPVLSEFRHSKAKNEWQHCVAALVQIRRAHPGIWVDLPVGQVNARVRAR